MADLLYEPKRAMQALLLLLRPFLPGLLFLHLLINQLPYIASIKLYRVSSFHSASSSHQFDYIPGEGGWVVLQSPIIQKKENQMSDNQQSETGSGSGIPNHPFDQSQESDADNYVENEEERYYNDDEEGENEYGENDEEYDEENDEEENDEEQEEENDEENEQEYDEEEGMDEKLKSNIKSEISVSEPSKDPSQLTENFKNDGNFTKEYTFQPQFKGEHEIFQNSNKNSEVSSSINSKECNSRPVSNISYRSHLSNESEYKRQEIGNRYQTKVQSRASEINEIKHYEKLEVPENQPAFSSQDPFKKGTLKISNPYEISSPSNSIPTLEEMPRSQKYGNHYFSPSPTNDIAKGKQVNLGESHYVNNSLSNYYEGYYGELPHNSSVQSVNSKNDTIINLFGDMLKSGKYEGSYSEQTIGLNKPTKKHLQHTQKILQIQQQFEKQDSSDLYPNFIKKINKLDTIDMMNRAKSVNSVNQHNSDFNTNSINGSKTLEYSVAERPEIKENYNYYQAQSKNYSAIVEEKTHSYVQGPSSHIEVKNYTKSNPVVNFDEDDSIFFKPKKSQLRVISEVTASKESITLPKHHDQHQDTKGSIYRQFSDTRILKLLKQPHKTKVQIMRNRFKGQHFNL